MTELLPCPFCGKKPQLLEPDDSNKLWSVSCLSCVSIDLEELTEERAIQKWNRRYYPAEVQQAIEKMKPKKPNRHGGGLTPGGNIPCPGCGNATYILSGFKFCPHCGQRLDWSE